MRSDYQPFVPFDPNSVQLMKTRSGLVVSNIGSSGEDGVRFGVADDGSDFLLTFMIIFTVGVIVLLGVAYFTLHSIPEKMAHETNLPHRFY